MARTVKARTTCYDNIAQANATGVERTISGAAPPANTTWGNTENISVGVDYGADENIIVTATNLLAIERLTP
jgi:hypothetical protein